MGCSNEVRRMNPCFGKFAALAALIAYSIIRAPHGMRSQTIRVVEDRKGKLEIALLAGAFLGAFLPAIWAVTGFPAGADHPLHPAPYALGLLLLVVGLWLFQRTHIDLGTNWSFTLQTRDGHRLVTTGIHERIRHPMYSATFLIGIAHLLFIPNWIVGPACLVTFGILYVFRVAREERLMLDRFGHEYEAYLRKSGRLLPRLHSGVARVHRRGSLEEMPQQRHGEE